MRYKTDEIYDLVTDAVTFMLFNERTQIYKNIISCALNTSGRELWTQIDGIIRENPFKPLPEIDTINNILKNAEVKNGK